MDKAISIATAAGMRSLDIASKLFLTPPRELWGLIGLVICIASVIIYVMRSYVTADPNEWLIIIRDGEHYKSKVGMTALVLPNESYVKFSSLIQQVYFRAMNVTVEMQGVSIEGNAFWTVFREGEGPFKCYKYMQGGSANDHVRTLCESIIRNELANSKLDDVLKNRNMLRDNIKSNLQPQLKGWGIYLETIELTEVKICSKKLFEDLQAEFKQETSLKANELKIASNEQLTKNRLISEIKMTKTEEENRTRRQTDDNKQELERKQEDATYYENTCALEKKKIINETVLSMDKLEMEGEISRKKLENEQKLEQERKDFEIETIKKEIELAKQHTPLTLKKYTIDSNERIYRNLKLGETRINQFLGTGDPRNQSLGSLLPGLNLPE